MPLTNFGAILNFAETMERDDMEFYRNVSSSAVAAPHRDLLEALAEDSRKNLSMVQRTRRENVTEMILEPIRGFARERYQEAPGGEGGDVSTILAAAVSRENRSIRYYTDAAEKIRALPEVSGALKTLAKRRSKRCAQLQSLSR
jgi:rubrerythrin